MLTLLYLALAVLGACYVLIAAFFGHVTDSVAVHGAHALPHQPAEGHGAHDSAGPGIRYGIDGAGHASAAAHAPAAPVFHFPFFSPLALATLLAAVGAYGLICLFGLHTSEGVSLLVALPAAFLTSYAVTWLAWRLVSGARSTGVIRDEDLVGAAGEVTTPVPAGGIGEVMATVRGQGHAAPAREEGGAALARGAAVTVVRVVGSTLVVRGERAAAGQRTP